MFDPTAFDDFTPPVPATYDADEVLIFGGQFADTYTEKFLTDPLDRFHYEEIVRNAVADAVEKVMTEWKGGAPVPLPEELRNAMTQVADVVAPAVLSAAKADAGGESF